MSEENRGLTPVQKSQLKWTLFAVSFFTMGAFVIYPALASISRAFPDASDFTIQLCSSAFGVVSMLCSLLADAIGRVLTRKQMLVAGYAILVLCGIGGFCLQWSIFTLLFWCAMAGAGVGVFVPACSALMMDCFSGSEQEQLVGRQNIFVNFGGIILSLVGGYLSAWNWKATFLGFLLALPILALVVKFVPRNPPAVKQTAPASSSLRERIPPGSCLILILMDMLYVLVYIVFSQNFALLLTERVGVSMADAFSGAGSALFMFAGACGGFLFSKVTKYLHDGLFVVACVTTGIGFAIVSVGSVLPVLIVGIFLGGIGFSFIVPQTLVDISMRVNPLQSLFASSLLMGVAPNLGGTLSPLLFTKLSVVMGHNDVAFRLKFASVMAFVLGIGYLVLILVGRQQEKKLS